METIAVLETAVLIYLKSLGGATVPEIAEYLSCQRLTTTANYLSLQLRNLEYRGLVEQVGKRRPPSNNGPTLNLWALTSRGKEEASE